MKTINRTDPVAFEWPEYGLYVFSSRHDKSFKMDYSRHEYVEFSYVEAGSGTYEITGKHYEALPNSLILIRPKTEHRIVDDSSEPLELINVCFEMSFFEENSFFLECFEELSEQFLRQPIIYMENQLLAFETKKAFRNLLFLQRENDIYVHLHLWSTFIKYLVEISSLFNQVNNNSTYRTDVAMDNIIAHLQKNFIQEVSPRELSQLSGYSYRRVTELFRKKTGQTLLQYQTNLRVDYAKELLLSTGNILHSSLNCGYDDLSTFYRVFKKLTGKTPKQFIDMDKNDRDLTKTKKNEKTK